MTEGSEQYPPPVFFVSVDSKGSYRSSFLQVWILKGLRAGNFGQNTAKRGDRPQVRSLKELRVRLSRVRGPGRLATSCQR